jgi:hypothetical protein
MNTSNNRLGVRIPLHRRHLLQSLSTSARQLFRNRIRKGEQHRVLNYTQLTNLSGENLFCAATSGPSAPVSPQLAKTPTTCVS